MSAVAFDNSSYDSQAIQGDEVDEYNTEIKLNIRGHPFTITRDELMALPESILLCLFPNGVFVDIDGNVISNLTEDDIVYVNFSPECFRYICDSFNSAALELSPSNRHDVYDLNDTDVLNDKPSIIVLREDLDYYCIPPIKGFTVDQMKELKLLVGDELVQNPRLFDGLGYSPGKQLGPAEQHLLDMLCSSGFSVTGDWGHRSMEPGKTVIFSLALVRLKQQVEEVTPQDSPSLRPTTSASSSGNPGRSRLSTFAHNAVRNASRSVSRNRSQKRDTNTTATKLLLFWKKPARKCWWSNEEIEVDLSHLGLKDSEGNLLAKTVVKVHIRRVWTLELSVIGVQ
ncbi:unnamed protein product [Kuraishia capsulata CBS 1993]|uniref:Growth regulation protein n=1 Tax=Kuraishia capsulata CBS 1993 TaxID=1382522 RepID=W6MKB1_9ASCO|nr:uncharacterized protein KUCA_T00002760001 [Kuraishia capsulata CBS 1993]CDK26786.1 unnamed protein product [Kuraishia capsulata CBS 1993]